MLSLWIFIATATIAIRCANSHGYVYSPPSRSCLCHDRSNELSNDPSLCGPVRWEPQSVEGSCGFPSGGPPDGKLASGGQSLFSNLDKPSDLWSVNFINYTNSRYVEQTFRWRITAVHKSVKFRVFVTNENYNATDHPLRRDDLHMEDDHVCVQRVSRPAALHNVTCKFPRTAIRPDRQQAFLAIWDVENNFNAFYQIIDFRANLDETRAEIPIVCPNSTTLTINAANAKSIMIVFRD